MDSRLCEHGVCVNFAGGYRCECDMGYTAEDKQRRCVGKYLPNVAPDIHLRQKA